MSDLRHRIMKSASTFVVLLGLLAFAFSSSGCMVSFSKSKEIHRIKVSTTPEKAAVWTKVMGSKTAIGTAPVDVSVPHVRRTRHFHFWTTLLYNLIGGAGVVAGSVLVARGEGAARGIGVASLSVGMLALVLGLSGLYVGLRDNSRDLAPQTPITIGASLPGYADSWTKLKVPPNPGKLHLKLQRAGGAIATVTSKPAVTPAKDRPIVAVFQIQDKKLDNKQAGELADYLAGQLMASGKFRTVPGAQLRGQLSKSKKESYRNCYDQSCQIELGRAVAAQKTLATKVLRVGKTCTLTSVLYDLKTEAGEGAASTTGGCSTAELLAGLKRNAESLAKAR